jgi:uncharacterized protein YbjT (DUF2867 family)
MDQPKKKAILLGATGLIGSLLLTKLLDTAAYEAVTVFVRRPITAHPKLKQIVLEDLSDMEQHAAAFDGMEDVFCALGTTIKTAGSQERFREVDYGYPVCAAQLAKEAGAQRYVIVTSMGADVKSKFFYNRVKGETEAAIRALQLPMVSIVRPSLLLGDRAEFRSGERLTKVLSRSIAFVFSGRLLRYRPIEARDVAAIMFRVAQMYSPGTHIYENDQMHRMAPGS